MCYNILFKDKGGAIGYVDGCPGKNFFDRHPPEFVIKNAPYNFKYLTKKYLDFLDYKVKCKELLILKINNHNEINKWMKKNEKLLNKFHV